MHPYLQQTKLLQFCGQHDIHVTAYTPLGNTYGLMPGALDAIKEPVILEIAKMHDKSPGQIILKYLVYKLCQVFDQLINFF